jgi:hypothetical protein
MIKHFLFSLMLLGAGPLLAAPKDDVSAAATALGNAANYSWQTTQDFGPNSQLQMGPADGKTGKDGYTVVSLDLMGNTGQFVRKGTNAVVQTNNGWQTLAETSQGDGGFGGGAAMFAAMRAQSLQVPAVEVTNLLATATDLKTDGEKITGALTEAGAKEQLSMGGRGRRGGTPPTVTNSKGTVSFWVADGKLTKYQTHVTGSVDRGGNPMDMDRTITTTIKDVGTTRVEVPEDAKKKLQ